MFREIGYGESMKAPPKEQIIRIDSVETGGAAYGGVKLRTFVSAERGATAFSTGIATFKPGSRLPCHAHPVSEAVTIISGIARLVVEGRAYVMSPLDCAHIPAGVPHSVENEDPTHELVAHSAFGSAQPAREVVGEPSSIEERGSGDPGNGDPETVIRFVKSPVYELSENAFFTDLFARRLGAVGICGGYGRFLPGASLPCHIHEYDESITIVSGQATCLVQGRRYHLSGCATAYIPTGLPHRFINKSDHDMAMIWVYVGDEPDRRIVDNGYCSGMLSWLQT